MAQQFTMQIVYNNIPRVTDDAVGMIRDAIAKAAFQIEAGAKSVVPVDTGNLKNSLTTNVEMGGMTAHVGTGVEYAPYVEFGTSRMAAQPYLFPSAEEVKPSFIDAMSKIVR